MRSEKISLLFLTNNLGMGGAERTLVNLVNRLDPSVYDITVRVLFNYGENRERLADNIKYEFIFNRIFRGVNLLLLAPKNLIYNWIVHGKHDVVIVHLHGILTKIVANAPEVQKTIAYIHADMRKSEFFKSFRTSAQAERCFESYDAVVAVSKSVENAFRNVAPWTTNVLTLYNIFELNKIREQTNEALDDGFLLNSSIINICSVGNLTEVKGYMRLLRVVQNLISKGLVFNLVIIGEGPERENLERYIKKFKLDEAVTLLGFKENPYRYMSRCDIVVSASYSEGMSSAVVEALAVGIPVIATECAGMTEILGRGNEYGLIVENSESGLTDGLFRMITDVNLRKYYQNQSQKRIKIFEPEKAMESFRNLIDAVLAK